jgi:hypothetical protein
MDTDDALFPAGQFTRELTPVTRPNGKVYQPIKRPAAIEVEEYNDDTAVYVLRTHDIDRAYALAIRLGLGDVHLDSAHQTWIRDTFRGGRRVFDTDAVHGCPAVTFEVT